MDQPALFSVDCIGGCRNVERARRERGSRDGDEHIARSELRWRDGCQVQPDQRLETFANDRIGETAASLRW
jgi:hypothetical protein